MYKYIILYIYGIEWFAYMLPLPKWCDTGFISVAVTCKQIILYLHCEEMVVLWDLYKLFGVGGGGARIKGTREGCVMGLMSGMFGWY